MKSSFVQVVICVIVLTMITGYLAYIGSIAVIFPATILLMSPLLIPLIQDIINHSKR